MPIIRSLLLLLALCWFGTGEAKAACTLIGGNPSSGYNNGDWACDDEGEAYAKVASMGIPSYYASCGMINVRVVRASSNSYSQHMTYPGNTCGIGYQMDIGTGSAIFPANNTCSNRTDYVGPPPISTATGRPVPGSLQCSDGCTLAWFPNGDGTWTGDYSPSSTGCTHNSVVENCAFLGPGWKWNAYSQLCEPPVTKCEEGEYIDPETGTCGEACPAGMKLDEWGACTSMDNDCPAGNVRSPSGQCLPGEGQCAAGEARTSQGTCGRDRDGDGIADVDDPDIDGDGIPNEDDPDADGDGIPDDEQDGKPGQEEEASGGDSCDAPPRCSGSAIQCLQVKIQWRIDCNTRKTGNVSGGTCGAVPVCVGKGCDALEYAQLIQQWRASCALEQLVNRAGGTPGGGGADGSGAMDPVSGDGVLGDDLDPGSVTRVREGDIEFSDTGYGWTRSCPSIPSIDVMGQTIDLDTSVFCDWMKLGGVFVMIMAHLAGLAIVMRA